MPASATPKNRETEEERKPPAPVGASVYDKILPQSIAFRPNQQPAVLSMAGGEVVPSFPPAAAVMPLIAFLHDNAGKPAGWHRNAERRARGIFPVPSLSCQLETWERQLVRVCVCVCVIMWNCENAHWIIGLFLLLSFLCRALREPIFS